MLPYGAYEFSVPESFHLESTWEWEWEGNKIFMLRVPKNFYGKTKCYIFWSKYFNHYFIYFYK